MYASDLKKGMRVYLKGGMWATILDDKKGFTRSVEMEEPYHEIGSVYVKDIEKVRLASGICEPVELSPKQRKQAGMAARLGL